jgi:hypothetical protein
MRQAKRLSARTVATLTKPGRHSDGGNLYLLITKTESGLSKRWVFMFTHGGKQREAGFGPASVVTLAEARGKAQEWRSMLAKGNRIPSPQSRPPGRPPAVVKHLGNAPAS